MMNRFETKARVNLIWFGRRRGGVRRWIIGPNFVGAVYMDDSYRKIEDQGIYGVYVYEDGDCIGGWGQGLGS